MASVTVADRAFQNTVYKMHNKVLPPRWNKNSEVFIFWYQINLQTMKIRDRWKIQRI